MTSGQHPATVFTPKPPAGVHADVFADRVVVPAVLLRAVGPQHAVTLSVLLVWHACRQQDDLGSINPTRTDWAAIGLPDIDTSLTFLQNAGLIEHDEDGIRVLDDKIADLVTTVTARIQPSSDTTDRDPETEARFVAAEHLCRLLADLIVANGSKRPTITRTWVTDMEKLLRIDQRSPTQVEHAILWCQADPFWAPNIESPFKLRKQFDKLRQSARRDGKQTAQDKMRRAEAMLKNTEPGTRPDDSFIGPGDGHPVGDWASEFGVQEEIIDTDTPESAT